MKRATTLVMTSGALLFAAAILPAHGAEDRSAPNPEFKRLDRDGNGYLDAAEARQIEGFERAFKEADENGDGRLTPDEFVKAQSVHERFAAAQFVDDSIITARVKAALLKDAGVSGLGVNVETHKGTVLLSGFVDNQSQAQRAVEIAAQVRGVAAVKNGLFVKG